MYHLLMTHTDNAILRAVANI